MQKAHEDPTKKSLLKWMLLGVFVLTVGAGVYFGYKYYQNYQANKIYSVNDNVGFPDFDIKVIKAEFKPVDLPLDKEEVSKYGGLEQPEDCSQLSDIPRREAQIIGSFPNPERIIPHDPSDKTYCNWRNSSRDEIRKYSGENKQLVIDYKITSKNSVDTSKFNIELMPDSGRKLGERVNSLNDNQFLERNDLDIHAKHTTFLVEYKPYHKSNIGDDINKGLERTGYIYTDIRNSEKSVDLKIDYRGQTRIVRISQ